MSKSNISRYFDDEKKDLYTANNYYKYALKAFNNTNILKEQQGITPLVIAGYTTAKSELTEALLFGKIDSCAPLAYFNQEGLDGVKSLYNQKLFLVIGSKLGDQKCTASLAKLQNNNYDVEKEANIWVNHINTYKRNLDKEITSSEAVTSQTFLENELKKYGVSLDAYNAHINIVKSKEEVSENYTPPPQPKQAANYYDPYNNKNTTTTTSYNQPEQPKYYAAQPPQPKQAAVYNYDAHSHNNTANTAYYAPPAAPYYSPQPPQVTVVKIGGNAPDVHKCEIL